MVRVTVAAIAVAVLMGANGCGVPAPEPGPSPGITGGLGRSAPPSVPASPTSQPGTSRRIDVYAPPGWVALADVDSSIIEEIRYAGAHNFVGRPIEGYWEPLCLLPLVTARALHRVQLAAVVEGLSLKVYDCYRPIRAGADFGTWGGHPADQQTRAEFYPSLSKVDLFRQGFVAGGVSSHSRGSAVDLTLVALPPTGQRGYVPGEPLVACTAPAGTRFPDDSVDMGTGFDCFDSRAHTDDARIVGPAHENRLRLRRLMAVGGFVNYRNEWWHFDLANPPFGGTSFDFPVARAALVP